MFIEPVQAQLSRRADAGAVVGAGANFEEVVAAFMRCLSERRVTETMRRTMSALAVEIARGWRDEFSRSVSLKLNAFFLAPHCEALSAYLRDGLLELDMDEIRLTIPEPSERPAERAELLKAESPSSPLTRRSSAASRRSSAPSRGESGDSLWYMCVRGFKNKLMTPGV